MVNPGLLATGSVGLLTVLAIALVFQFGAAALVPLGLFSLVLLVVGARRSPPRGRASNGPFGQRKA